MAKGRYVREPRLPCNPKPPKVRITGKPERKGWMDALMPPALDLRPSYSDVTIFAPDGRKVGVMRRLPDGKTVREMETA